MSHPEQRGLEEEGGEGKGYKPQEGVVLDVAKSSEGNYGERPFLSTTWDLEALLSFDLESKPQGGEGYDKQHGDKKGYEPQSSLSSSSSGPIRFPQSQSSGSQNLSFAAAPPQWWPLFEDGHPMTHMYRLIDNVHGQDLPVPAVGTSPMVPLCQLNPAGEAQVVPELNQSSVPLRELLPGNTEAT